MANYKSKEKKSSGCNFYDKGDNGEFINGWNFDKYRGMLTAFVFPYKNTGSINKSKKGHESVSMMCKVFYKNSGVEKLYPVQMNIKTHTVFISELNMVLSPSKDYFGDVPNKSWGKR